MTFGLHCAQLICGKYELPTDFHAAIAGIIDREIKTYAEKTGAFSPELEKSVDGREIPPPYDKLAAYIKKIGARFTPEAFLAHYKSNGWMVGKTKMKDWQGACDTWKINERKNGIGQQPELFSKPRSAYDIQTRLDACRERLRNLANPGGSAWPVRLEGNALKTANDLRATIRQLENELCKA